LFSKYHQLTDAIDSISGVALIAFTPVTHVPCRGTDVRCNRSARSVRMTHVSCIGITLSRICAHW